MCTYLQPRGRTYYFRRAIPAELRPALGGKTEFMVSLRTKDRDEAKRRIPHHTIETDKLLAEARAQIASNSPETARQSSPSSAGSRWQDAMMQASLEAAELSYRDQMEKEERYESREVLRERLRQTFRLSTAEITPEEAAMRDLLREAREWSDDDAAQASAAVWIAQRGSFNLTPVGMSYADLAATLLAAVGTIVAIFGGILALAALWGFQQLKRDAVDAAGAAGTAHLKEQIENGSIRAYIEGEIARLADAEFKSDRMDQRINRRVDAVTFGRPDADRLLDEDDDGGDQ